MSNGFKYELGSKAKDKVTGYKGLIIARTEWLYGCRRYVLQAQELKDGKPIETVCVDQDAVEIVEEAPPHKMSERGGDAPSPTRAPDPTR
jgi:hypothetical protein